MKSHPSLILIPLAAFMRPVAAAPAAPVTPAVPSNESAMAASIFVGRPAACFLAPPGRAGRGEHGFDFDLSVKKSALRLHFGRWRRWFPHCAGGRAAVMFTGACGKTEGQQNEQEIMPQEKEAGGMLKLTVHANVTAVAGECFSK